MNYVAYIISPYLLVFTFLLQQNASPLEISRLDSYAIPNLSRQVLADSVGSNTAEATAEPVDDSTPLPSNEIPKTDNATWYGTEGVSAFASFGAFVISIVAFWASQRGASAQQIREKREELRGLLVQLVSLRGEHGVSYKIEDEAERAMSSVHRNIMRSVYLEAAKSLARQIPQKVNAAEYHILGTEHYSEGDYKQARKYYELAAKQSAFSSLFKQSEIWRALANTYILSDPNMQDPQKAREYYEKSIKVLDQQTDYYSVYTRVYAYREWTNGEISLLNYTKARELLLEAQKEFCKIPDTAGFDMAYELRYTANCWRLLGQNSFSARLIRKDSDTESRKLDTELGRKSFEKSLEDLQAASNRYGENDYSINAKALVYHDWGNSEIAIGEREKGLGLLHQAQNIYASISDAYVWKQVRLVAIAEALRSASQSIAPVDLTAPTALQPIDMVSPDELGLSPDPVAAIDGSIATSLSQSTDETGPMNLILPIDLDVSLTIPVDATLQPTDINEPDEAQKAPTENT